MSDTEHSAENDALLAEFETLALSLINAQVSEEGSDYQAGVIDAGVELATLCAHFRNRVIPPGRGQS